MVGMLVALLVGPSFFFLGRFFLPSPFPMCQKLRGRLVILVVRGTEYDEDDDSSVGIELHDMKEDTDECKCDDFLDDSDAVL